MKSASRLFSKISFVGVMVLTPMASIAGTGTAYLWYTNPTSDILMATVNVNKTYNQTYFSILGWNTNKEGMGYLGIQTHNNGEPTYNLTLDDPVNSTGVPIKAVYTKPLTQTSPIGIKQEGLTYTDYSSSWLLNQPVTALVRSWTTPTGTQLGLWTFDTAFNSWTQHAIFETPVRDVTFAAYSATSFLENWGGLNKTITRSADYYNVWARSTLGTWSSISQAGMTVSEGTPTTAKQHGLDSSGSRFVLQQGADYTFGFNNPLQLTSKSTDTSPTIAPLQLTSYTYFYNSTTPQIQINWSIANTGAPQFSYKVIATKALTGEVVASLTNVVPHTRSITLPLPTVSSVTDVDIKLVLQDVIDRTTSYTIARVALPVIASPTPSPTPTPTPTPTPSPTTYPDPKVPTYTNLKLQSVNSGMFLTVNTSYSLSLGFLSFNLSNNSTITQDYSNLFGNNQTWRIEPTLYANEFNIRSSSNNQCLNVPTYTEGAYLNTANCSSNAGVRFRIKSDKYGRPTLVSSMTGKCVDVPNSSKLAGEKLVQWGCHGGANQAWSLNY